MMAAVFAKEDAAERGDEALTHDDAVALAFFEAIGGAGAPVTIFTFDADG